MIIKTNNIAVAAYIKMNNSLLKYENNYFFFEVDKSLEEYEIEYYNSCCSKHDSEILKLRNIKKYK